MKPISLRSAAGARASRRSAPGLSPASACWAAGTASLVCCGTAPRMPASAVSACASACASACGAGALACAAMSIPRAPSNSMRGSSASRRVRRVFGFFGAAFFDMARPHSESALPYQYRNRPVGKVLDYESQRGLDAHLAVDHRVRPRQLAERLDEHAEDAVLCHERAVRALLDINGTAVNRCEQRPRQLGLR